jgi:hypothetical protein
VGKLRRRHIDVDAEGDVVAEFEPGGVGAYFDVLDLGGPVLGEEDVVDVVGAGELRDGPEDVDLFFDGGEVFVAGG